MVASTYRSSAALPHALMPVLVSSLAFAACSRSSPQREPARETVVVAAASSSVEAFNEIAHAFEEATGMSVKISYGSSGLLAKQINAGAPYDLFAAANSSYIDEVSASGVCEAASKTIYAGGRLVMWSKANRVAPPKDLHDLVDLRFRRIALANPEHAPYGQAAKEALQAAGIWDLVQSRIVYGENIRQALNFAETGNADVALTAYALVLHDTANPWTLVGNEGHRALEQAMTLCSHGSNHDGAKSLMQFIQSAQGRAILNKHGFRTSELRSSDSP